VLAVRTAEGHLLALVFGYACHNTTLAFYQWCGDYAGFAQIALGKNHPDTMAMFFMGCGGDQNPIPRRTVGLCEKYGNQLAASVEEVLQAPLRPISPSLRTAFDLVTFHYERNVTREELEEAVGGANALRGRWAKRMLAILDEGKTFPQTYPYPVQVWRLGEQLWISLGAEAVVDYALRFKKEYGPGTWVGGYAHTQVSYIPSRRVWNEGGYEGGGFLYEYGHPADWWTEDTEDRIAATVARLVQAVSK
jgi:hypothetical protein